jgi:PhnB protein
MTNASRNDTDAAAIHKTIDDRSQALRAKDARGVLAHHSEDYVLFSLAPPLAVTVAGDSEGLQDWFDTWDGPIGYELHDRVIETGGDIGFCRALAHMTGRKIGGEKVDLWFRLTLCLRRADTRWRITHEHESVPFYMDGSYRAAVDLKP